MESHMAGGAVAARTWAAAVAITGAKITDALIMVALITRAAATASVRTIARMSGATLVTQAEEANRVGAKANATKMTAHGMRKRAIISLEEARNVRAALRARMCAAAT